MKLYNIFQEVILEESSKEQHLLNEGVIEELLSAMKDTIYEI
jgi:hypothetical protein